LQLRIAPRPPTSLLEQKSSATKEETAMRIVETTAAGIVAVAAQILVIATVMI
jgi:hypothetical protein